MISLLISVAQTVTSSLRQSARDASSLLVLPRPAALPPKALVVSKYSFEPIREQHTSSESLDVYPEQEMMLTRVEHAETGSWPVAVSRTLDRLG